jgi:hypothetical protein
VQSNNLSPNYRDGWREALDVAFEKANQELENDGL